MEIKAFPVPHVTKIDVSHTLGMDLRDYFAAKAMNGIIKKVELTVLQDSINNIASFSYNFADAMMKERNKSQ